MDYHTLKMIKKEVDRQKAFGPGPSPFGVVKADVDLVSPSPRMPKTDTSQIETEIIISSKKKSSGTRLHRAEPGMIVKVRFEYFNLVIFELDNIDLGNKACVK